MNARAIHQQRQIKRLDVVPTNDDVTERIADLFNILGSIRLRCRKTISLDDFVEHYRNCFESGCVWIAPMSCSVLTAPNKWVWLFMVLITPLHILSKTWHYLLFQHATQTLLGENINRDLPVHKGAPARS